MSPTIRPDDDPAWRERRRSYEPAPPEQEGSTLPTEPELPPFLETIRDEDEARPPVAYRGATSDPTFGYLIALALTIGLTPLIPDNTDLRYTLLWAVTTTFGVLAWLLGNGTRIGQETLENLGWGVVFGVMIGAPFLAFGGSTLMTAVHLLFENMTVGTVLAYLVFVMPMAETLFFRGTLQANRPFWLVGLASALWSVLVFFPVFWDEIGRFPAVALVIGTALLLMNIIYSYVCRRNGMAAAWLCQIVVNLVLVFLPFLSQAG
jgi:hypothetical protein